MANPLPVIDLFVGPGGLGEGFSSVLQKGTKTPACKIAISIEMDSLAPEALQLRAFFRQFSRWDVPDDFYEHIHNQLIIKIYSPNIPKQLGQLRKKYGVQGSEK